MTEDEAWEVWGAMHDEEKVTPAMRSGYVAPERITEEQALSRLMLRLGHARAKHPTFARNVYEAGEVIDAEMQELKQAIGCESRQRQIDEALDVAATAMRFVMGEHEQ